MMGVTGSLLIHTFIAEMETMTVWVKKEIVSFSN